MLVRSVRQTLAVQAENRSIDDQYLENIDVSMRNRMWLPC